MKLRLRSLDHLLFLGIIGFGLIYAWGTCLWNIPLPSFNGKPVIVDNSIWFFSALITPLAFFVSALLCRKRELAKYSWTYVTGILLASIGTFCAYFSPFALEPLQDILKLLAALGTGLGPVLLVTLWACLFTRLDLDLVERIVPFSFVMTLISSLIMPRMPFWIALILTTLFPVISGICLLQFNRRLATFFSSTILLNVARSEHIAPINIARMMGILLILSTLGCLLPFTPYGTPDNFEAFSTALGMFLAIGLALGWTFFSRHINLESLIRWMTLPVTLLILSSALPLPGNAYLSRILSNVVFTGLEIIMVLYFVQLAQRTQITESCLIGLGAGTTYLGVLLGRSIHDRLVEHVALYPSDVALICLILLSIYVLAMLLVPQRDTVLNSQGQSQIVQDELEAFPTKEPPTHTTLFPLQVDTCFRNLSDPPVLPTSQTASAMPNDLSQVDILTPPSALSFEATTQEVSETLSAPPTSSQTQRKERENLAQSYGLSPRETEIFLLLAQGRSRPYIRDALFLSKNTVATHIRHIYEKMDIHSQQELIDLVQEGHK